VEELCAECGDEVPVVVGTSPPNRFCSPVCEQDWRRDSARLEGEIVAVRRARDELLTSDRPDPRAVAMRVRALDAVLARLAERKARRRARVRI
jgi:hypothetical protein